MDFIITEKNKKKARKVRVKNENKWLVLRIIKWIFALISIASFVDGVFFVANNKIEKIERFGFVFSITLVLAFMTHAVIINLSSHWIQDRLNDKMWMDSSGLYYFQQVAFAAGLNSRHADSTGFSFMFSIESIRNVKYDAKSKRIEFIADGNGVCFSDVNRQMIDNEWPLNEFEAVFYDYFEPSLIKTLQNMGKDIEITKISNYSIFNNNI